MNDVKKEERGLYLVTVKAIIVNEEGKVLVLRRALARNPKYKSSENKLDLPGGVLEENEKISDRLKQEIKEELGIKVEIGPIIYACDFERGLNDEEIPTKGLRYLAFYEGGEIKLSWEHKSFKWLEIDEAIKIFSNDSFEKDKREALIKAKEYLELKNSLDGWKRCLADFENYRRRQAEIQTEAMSYSNQDLIMQILPVLDNFHASTEHIPEDQKNSAWVVGIMHIQKQLEQVLKDNGVEEIEAKEGDKFDPAFQEAVGNHAGKEAEALEHKIQKIVLKGYKMGDKIIRPVKVIVK